MVDERSNLLEKLAEKTITGKIVWKGTYEPGTFIASVEGELGLELSKSAGQFLSLKLFDTAGNELDSISEPVPTRPLTHSHPLFKLARLYDLAEDKAFDNRQTIERLARVEKVLDAL